jgi:hypothetical protein
VLMSVMNQRPDKATIEEVALVKGIDASFVEKDWFVTQVIAIISGIQIEGFEIIFSGGTALSKAHNLLHRFSEDIDFRILAKRHLRTRSALSDFKKAIIEALRQHGFSIEDHHIKARDQNRFFSIDLEYESVFPRADALRPHILIEMTARDIQLPPISLPVSSFINSLSRQPPEVECINCIAPVESAADKLSAIAWRIPDRVRNGQHDDPSIVRHIHDLSMLRDHAIARPDFENLVMSAMQEDDDRAKNDLSLAGMEMAEKFARMLEILDTDKAYPAEYDRFVKSVSYAESGQAPDFTNAMQSVRCLIDSITKQSPL